jgi:hypothetical protein
VRECGCYESPADEVERIAPKAAAGGSGWEQLLSETTPVSVESLNGESVLRSPRPFPRAGRASGRCSSDGSWVGDGCWTVTLSKPLRAGCTPRCSRSLPLRKHAHANAGGKLGYEILEIC